MSQRDESWTPLQCAQLAVDEDGVLARVERQLRMSSKATHDEVVVVGGMSLRSPSFQTRPGGVDSGLDAQAWPPSGSTMACPLG